MQKLAVSILALLLFTLPVEGEKIADLPELSKPTALTEDNGTLYVTDSEAIHVYSLHPFKYIRTFGRLGQGPGEFNSNPFLFVKPDELMIHTMGKVMTFSKDGNFLKQQNIPFVYFYMYYPLLPAGDNFIGLPLVVQEEKPHFIHTCNAYGPDFKPIKEFYRGGPPIFPPPPRRDGRFQKMDWELIPDCLGVGTAEDKVFIGDTRKGFYIAVFDKNGEPLYEIRKDEPLLKVPDDFRDRIWKELKESSNWEQAKERFDYKMKDYFPAYSTFKVKDGRIFVTTHAQKDGKYEIIVMDLKGNILKRAFSFPFDPREAIIVQAFVPFHIQYTVAGDTIYYILLDEKSGFYALNAVKIAP